MNIAEPTIVDKYFLMTWVYATSEHSFGVAKSVEDAKAVIAAKLGIEPVWIDPPEGSVVHSAMLNIRYGGDVLGGVLITPVALYEVKRDTMSEKS